MASKNDKWSLFKNYLHNELGITKEDIREWLEEAVREEARKLIADTLKSNDIRNRIDVAMREFHGWGEKPLKTEIDKEIERVNNIIGVPRPPKQANLFND